MKTFSVMWSPERDHAVAFAAISLQGLARCKYKWFADCRIIVVDISSNLIKAVKALPDFKASPQVVEREEDTVGVLWNIMFRIKRLPLRTL